MTFTRTTVLLTIGLAATGCTIALRDARNGPPPPSDPLDARLERCSTLGGKSADDPDCQSAFAEARTRILPLPEGK